VRLVPHGLLAAAAVLGGCQEKLTAPADCPALCPGGTPQVIDEVVDPIPLGDSSFSGYVQPPAAPSLLVSNGVRGYEQRAILRFPSRPDSVAVRDTFRTYVIDSVALGFTVLGLDTNLTGVQLQVYRMPRLIDSTTTYAQVDPAFTPANLITSIAIPADLNTGGIRTVLQGVDLAKVVIPPADSGVLALGLRLDAPVFTGVRIGAAASGTGGVFVTYTTLNVPDTGSARLRTFPLTATFNTSLSPVTEPLDPTLLTVGGEPAARSLLRFDLPARIRDSATIVRATLELTPVTPIIGVPTDPARLRARALLSDAGAKSPVETRISAVDTLEAGASGVVQVEVVRLIQGVWLPNPEAPTALMLSLTSAHGSGDLEGASFSRPVFYSTRAVDPALRPRLRISYLLSFPFENP
jgi:hypothetical protein